MTILRTATLFVSFTAATSLSAFAAPSQPAPSPTDTPSALASSSPAPDTSPAAAETPSDASPSPSPQAATPSPPASPSPAATPDVAHDLIETMWKFGAQKEWFSQSFLAAVPFTAIGPVLAQVRTALGDYRSTAGGNGTYLSTFAKGVQTIRIHLDGAGKIDGLFFPPPKLTSFNLDDATARLKALGGTLSYSILIADKHRAAYHQDMPLAVGSTFKLALLAGLRDRVAKHELAWAQVVPLRTQWKSLPSGILQKWPDGTPITIATYASDMISMSDNTAADSIASIVGERAIAPYAATNVPLLTTRELFVLRASSNADIEKQWVSANQAGRRTLRAEIATMPLPGADAIGSNPGDLRAEWHFSTDQLCRLMSRVSELPLMSINPGLADPRAFKHVAYKGGSEPGVLSMVTSVKTLGGRSACVAATINDSAHPIDENAFELDYAAILAAVSTM